jgi:hypothetical protein
VRAREMFARIAGLHAVKTLDQYDFNFATGARASRSRKPRLPFGRDLARTRVSRPLLDQLLDRLNAQRSIQTLSPAVRSRAIVLTSGVA